MVLTDHTSLWSMRHPFSVNHWDQLKTVLEFDARLIASIKAAEPTLVGKRSQKKTWFEKVHLTTAALI